MCSFRITNNKDGIDNNILNAINLLPGYFIMFPGKRINCKFGNSDCKRARGRSSAPITTVWPCFTSSPIMGMQRVACPSPQFKGQTRILCFIELGTNAKILNI